MSKMENGKIIDIIIEDMCTGHIMVWADAGNKEIIESVPGVTNCFEEGVRYPVFLDPRYDVKWVKEEIIARIKIGECDGMSKM